MIKTESKLTLKEKWTRNLLHNLHGCQSQWSQSIWAFSDQRRQWNLDYTEQWVVISINILTTKDTKHYARYYRNRLICSFAKANTEVVWQTT